MNAQPLVFGEVLWDCFPDGQQVLGGAPFNVAWHLHAFGIAPLFVSRVGQDEPGRMILHEMNKWGMNTSGIQVDNQYPTGRVSIDFVDHEPKYNIVYPSAYDFIQRDELPIIEKCPLLYHGSLALRDERTRETLEQIKKGHKADVFIDVNLRSPWWSRDLLKKELSSCTILKLNEEELELLQKDISPRNSAQHFVSLLFKENPLLSAVLLTRGSQGATMHARDASPLTISPQNTREMCDTVGAGDAFASVFILGHLEKWPPQITMARAQEFASEIVARQGATVHDRAFYQRIVNKWSQLHV